MATGSGKTKVLSLALVRNFFQQTSIFDYMFVDEGSFEKYKPRSFKELMDGFRDYK